MKRKKVTYHYDPDVDSLFIHQIDKHSYKESHECRGGTIVDFDWDDNPAAFEFLSTSKKFNVSINQLKNIQNISISVEIVDEIIILDFKLDFDNLQAEFKDKGLLNEDIENTKIEFYL